MKKHEFVENVVTLILYFLSFRNAFFLFLCRKAGHERTRRGKNREQPIEENDGVSSVQLILCKVLGVCLVILINFTVVFYFTHADDGEIV